MLNLNSLPNLRVLVVIGTIFITTLGSLYYLNKDNTINHSFNRENLKTGGKYQVSQTKVIEGYIFDVLLNKSKSLNEHLRYKVYLNDVFSTPYEAKSEVVKILNNSSKMWIVPIKWDIDHWSVDVIILHDNKEQNLKELLSQKQLIHSR